MENSQFEHPVSCWWMALNLFLRREGLDCLSMCTSTLALHVINMHDVHLCNEQVPAALMEGLIVRVRDESVRWELETQEISVDRQDSAAAFIQGLIRIINTELWGAQAGDRIDDRLALMQTYKCPRSGCGRNFVTCCEQESMLVLPLTASQSGTTVRVGSLLKELLLGHVASMRTHSGNGGFSDFDACPACHGQIRENITFVGAEVYKLPQVFLVGARRFEAAAGSDREATKADYDEPRGKKFYSLDRDGKCMQTKRAQLCNPIWLYHTGIYTLAQSLAHRLISQMTRICELRYRSRKSEKGRSPTSSVAAR